MNALYPSLQENLSYQQPSLPLAAKTRVSSSIPPSAGQTAGNTNSGCVNRKSRKTVKRKSATGRGHSSFAEKKGFLIAGRFCSSSPVLVIPCPPARVVHFRHYLSVDKPGKYYTLAVEADYADKLGCGEKSTTSKAIPRIMTKLSRYNLDI